MSMRVNRYRKPLGGGVDLRVADTIWVDRSRSNIVERKDFDIATDRARGEDRWKTRRPSDIVVPRFALFHLQVMNESNRIESEWRSAWALATTSDCIDAGVRTYILQCNASIDVPADGAIVLTGRQE